MSTQKVKVHVVSGTHWDREWRYTLEQSKLRLSHLIDGLLDILDRTPDYKCFHLDGGTVVLEDYFSVRPENRERVIKHIRDGRIILVNWYTLPDTFLVNPEALVRNLMWGKNTSREFGGAMRAGYTATSYGQNSQLPQIYQGFGINSAIFYRGTNKHQTPPIFRWRALDGSELFMIRGFDEVTRTNWFFYIHQPLVLGKPPRDLSYTFRRKEHPVHMADDETYESDFQINYEDPSFSTDPQKILETFEYLKAQAYPQKIGNHVFAMNMEDNALPYEPLPKMIDCMNKVLTEAEIVQSSLDEFVDTVIEVFKKQKKQHVHVGELRYSGIEPGFNGLLGMTQSSRTKLKILNERAETELIYVCEPLASLASIHGWEYPTKVLENAWRNLLQNQAHDSICGAAVDQVHEDMLTRFVAAKSVAREVTGKACQALWKKIDFSAYEATDFTLTVFNPSGMKRSGVQLVVVDIPKHQEDAGAIDPCTGIGADKGKSKVKKVDYSFFEILDTNGKPVPFEVLSHESIHMRIERELDTAVNFPCERIRLLMNVEVDPMGYRTYVLRPREPRYVHDPKPAGDRGLIAQPGGILENENLKIQMNPNGTFDLTDKATGRLLSNLHFFEDKGSVGNAHVEGYPMRDQTITSLGCNARISVVENSTLRGTIKVELVMTIPAGATLDKRDRLHETVDLPITSWITLKKGARRVEIRTKLNNQARDHRLRVMIPTYVKTNEVAVENCYAVDTRQFQWPAYGDNWEKYYPNQPMQNFIDLSDGKVGVALLNQGMREYEINDDPNRTVALTLLRTHRAYMVANENMTPEEFDKYTGLHCFGDLECKYAIYPHKGRWDNGGVLQEAYDFKVPYRIIQGVPRKGELPPAHTFISLSDPRLMISALTQSDDRKGYVLRFWNSSDKTVKSDLVLNLPVKQVEKVRLDEEKVIEKLKESGKKYSLAVKPHEVVTLRLTTG